MSSLLVLCFYPNNINNNLTPYLSSQPFHNQTDQHALLARITQKEQQCGTGTWHTAHGKGLDDDHTSMPLKTERKPNPKINPEPVNQQNVYSPPKGTINPELPRLR